MANVRGYTTQRKGLVGKKSHIYTDHRLKRVFISQEQRNYSKGRRRRGGAFVVYAESKALGAVRVEDAYYQTVTKEYTPTAKESLAFAASLFDQLAAAEPLVCDQEGGW